MGKYSIVKWIPIYVGTSALKELRISQTYKPHTAHFDPKSPSCVTNQMLNRSNVFT